MIRLIQVEFVKLRTTRLTYGLLATAVVLTALFAALEASRAGSGSVAPLSTAAGLDAVITGGVWALLFATVLGVSVSAGEFRHAAITATYLASPRRDRVLAAKCVAAAGAGSVFGLAGWLIATGIGLGLASADGYPVAIGTATLARYAAGHAVAGALLAGVGVGIGALVRSQLAAVIGVFVWAIVVESIAGGLYNAVQPYLPCTAAAALSGSVLGGAAFGPAHGAASTATPLPFAAAVALLAVIALALTAIAARTSVEQDVS